MENDKIFKCENCGNNLDFYPEETKLICHQCGKIYDIENIKETEVHNTREVIENKEEMKKWQAEERVVNCSNCGGEIVLKQGEITTICPYCETKYVSDLKELPSLKPDAIIPFAFDKEKAKKNFIFNIKKKFFAPRKFKKSNCDTEITGFYVSSFNFSADTINSYSGLLCRNETYYSNGKTRTRTISFRVSGTKDVKLRNVDIETSSLINMEKFNGIKPYDYSKKLKPKREYLIGFPAMHYSDDFNDTKKIAYNVMANSIRANILSAYTYSYVDYLNVSTTYSNETCYYALLPVYTVKYEYNKKTYVTYMNGQTGQINKDYPQSIWKKIGVGLLSLLFVGGIIALAVCL